MLLKQKLAPCSLAPVST